MNILIVSSDRTGHGHKSIAMSLKERLEAHENSPSVTIVNGFEWGGRLGYLIESSYYPMIKYARFLWKVYFDWSSKHTRAMNAFSSAFMRKGVRKTLDRVKPDIIVTVHPGFVGALLDTLENLKRPIPVISLIADLLEFSNLWIDKRSAFTVCPNVRVEEKVLSHGIPKDRIKTCGFPIRKSFCEWRKNPDSHAGRTKRLSILLVNGSETRKNMVRMAKTILSGYDCALTIICGRDERLKAELEREFGGKYEDRLTIIGYVTNMEYYMCRHDMLIARGGPNVLMEAVCCHIPVVIIGTLPGQEAGNVEYMLDGGLGVFCGDRHSLKNAIDSLLEDNARRLSEIRRKQEEAGEADAAEAAARLILETLEGQKSKPIERQATLL